MNSAPYTIAVIRGGPVDARGNSSLSAGRDLLATLQRGFLDVMDIVVDSIGAWHHKGLITDPHTVFTKATHYIDLVDGNKSMHHHGLAKRMGVPHLLTHGQGFVMNREDVYRTLRQSGVSVPESDMIRMSEGVSVPVLREVWRTYHTPLLVRSVDESTGTSSRLVRGFGDLLTAVDGIHNNGSDVQILTYEERPHYHVAVVPVFRGDEYYRTMFTVANPVKHKTPNSSTNHTLARIASDRQLELSQYVKSAAASLPFDEWYGVDLIESRNGPKIVNVVQNPNYGKGGRFMNALETTGVTIQEVVGVRLGV